MKDNETFVGVTLSRDKFLRESIRAAFGNDFFDICALHHLPEYNPRTFAPWVHELHCKRGINSETMDRAKAYVVNYFLCPDADCDLKVYAHMEAIWPKHENKRRSISIFNLRIEWWKQ